ncbi:TIGR04282 family arsenosugar biosynthesis glycosyltransferase [Salinisphaera sp. T31B1]|uniref:TIGR04282 family arsenosugar biosynthesis glycosyltransferase n=1 Tax=Salinisphaera sp. T31B1 TaxID=727963 RepID=UPI00334156F7
MSFANPLDRPADVSSIAPPLHLLIFAKAPRYGYCKTRLARRLGHCRATRIYRALLEHAVLHARRAHHGPVIVVCAPDTRHPFFQRMARRHDVRLVRQPRGDLGRRMHRALATATTDGAPAILMGSDQPVLEDGWLADARRSLDVEDAWLAPCTDGGYWAIGLRRAAAGVFRGPRWSSARVARHTRTRLRALAGPWHEWHPRRDIDDARDWLRLSAPRRSALSRQATMPGIRFVRA